MSVPGVLVAVLALLAVPPSAASADSLVEPRVQVSLDGVHWAPQPDVAWLDPAPRWVPGDVRSVRLLLRGAGAGPEDVVVAVEERAGSPSAWLDVDARRGDGAWVPLGGSDAGLEVPDLAPGEVVAVTVRVRVPADAPNRVQRRTTVLGLHVRGGPRTTGVGDLPSGADVPRRSGASVDLLADRGVDLPPWLPPLVVLLAGGGAFARARRLPTPLEEHPRA